MLTVHRICTCSRLFSTVAATQEFHRTEENGTVHVTSVNAQSSEKSIVELSRNNNSKARRFRREFHLPEEALAGLRQVLVECKTMPKQLQHAADQLNEKLNQRRFPASSAVVKKERDRIKSSLMSKDKHFEDILVDEKIKQAREYDLRHKVDKVMKKNRYNWKPLTFENKEAAATYALARLAPNYAEIARCLEELPDFNPETALDFGSGSGAGYWAIREKFPTTKEISLIDTCDNMTKMAMDIMRVENGQIPDKRVQFRRHLLPSLQTTYDLVIGHRFMSEIGSEETRLEMVQSLWARTNKYLVLIESGMDDSFEILLNMRDYLLTAGTTINIDATLQLLDKRKILSPYLQKSINEIMYNKRTTDIEKFSLLREMIPEEIRIPTMLPTATIVAPCPHDLGCPLRGKSSCTFDIRWRPIRADGKRGSRERDGTETGKFSFFILEKGARQTGENIDRLLKIRKMNGHATCDVCTAYRGIQRVTVSKRAHQLYQAVKTRRNGELFPLKMQTKVTEGAFDIYEYAKATVNQ